MNILKNMMITGFIVISCMGYLSGMTNPNKDLFRALYGQKETVYNPKTGEDEEMLDIDLSEVLEALKVGANPDQNFGLAISGGNLEAIMLLLEKGANVNMVDEAGNTPLFHTVTTFQRFQHPEPQGVAELLLSRGADINHVNNKGQTVLDYLLYWNEMDRGANPGSKRQSYYSKYEQFLREHGAVERSKIKS
jgi:hypothetical protein